MTTRGRIVGWAHSRFGKLDNLSSEELVAGVAKQALEHAGVDGDQVDAIFVGTMNNGMVKQDFPASLVMNAEPSLRFKPATRVENACATGSAAVYQGLQAIDAQRARVVLVVGYEKMTEKSSAEIGEILKTACYQKEEGDIKAGFVGVFAVIAQRYFDKYGDQTEALAHIAVKNHANGVRNPYAQMRKDLGLEFCLSVSDKNPIVAPPLKRSDCSLISDGAAAIVLMDDRLAAGRANNVRFRANAHVNDFIPISRRDVTLFEGPRMAWQRALAQAGVSIYDLSVVETHDCFTIAELIEYEAMGLTEPGQGARAILEGWTLRNGRLPVNPSGGLKAKGHPIGATGVSMHVLGAMQATGQAGDMQVLKAGPVGVFNMGGAAVANYVSILEAA